MEHRLADIGRAVHRLRPDQGRVARRNARTALRKTARRLLAQMDDDYPLPKKETSAPVVRKRRSRSLARALDDLEGWVLLDRLGRDKRDNIVVTKTTTRIGADGGLYVPQWAALAADSRSKLRALRRDVTGQKALVAVDVLRRMRGPVIVAGAPLKFVSGFDYAKQDADTIMAIVYRQHGKTKTLKVHALEYFKKGNDDKC